MGMGVGVLWEWGRKNIGRGWVVGFCPGEWFTRGGGAMSFWVLRREGVGCGGGICSGFCIGRDGLGVGGDGFPSFGQGDGWVAGWGELWVFGAWGVTRTEKKGEDLVRLGEKGWVGCTKLLKYPCHVIKLDRLLDEVNGRGAN
ncbi:unnamed protein product [Prunus armeniaca]